MPAFDRVFLSPSGAEVEKALTQAVAGANKRCTSGQLELGPRQVRPVLPRLASQPEGALLWKANKEDRQRSTEALLVWWVDRLGRPHVRVAAQRREPGRELWEHRFAPPGDSRPPLWFVHPERVYLRTRPGEERELIAVCSCGASGPPEEIGWLGERCGPCHDRGEEGAAQGGEGPAMLRGQGSAVVGVGFLEDGLVSMGRLFLATSGARPCNTHGPHRCCSGA